jgi:hypothetical protein
MCTPDILKPTWKIHMDHPAVVIVLTNYDDVCSINTEQHLHCKINEHNVPAYPGQLVAFDVTDYGACAINAEGQLACYLLASKLWKTYAAPAKLTKVTLNGKRICVLDALDIPYCILNWNPEAHSPSQWDTLFDRFKTISMQQPLFCATRRNDDIRCFVFHGEGGWKFLIGKLKHIILNARGLACGVAGDHTVWCRQGLPNAFDPRESDHEG